MSKPMNIIGSIALVGVVGTGIAFAIPESRNAMLDGFAVHSTEYKKVVDENLKLNEELTTRDALLYATQQELLQKQVKYSELETKYNSTLEKKQALETQLIETLKQKETLEIQVTELDGHITYLNGIIERNSGSAQQLQLELDELSVKYNNLLEQQETLQQQYSEQTQTLETVQTELNTMQTQLDEKQVEINNLNLQIEELSQNPRLESPFVEFNTNYGSLQWTPVDGADSYAVYTSANVESPVETSGIKYLSTGGYYYFTPTNEQEGGKETITYYVYALGSEKYFQPSLASNAIEITPTYVLEQVGTLYFLDPEKNIIVEADVSDFNNITFSAIDESFTKSYTSCHFDKSTTTYTIGDYVITGVTSKNTTNCQVTVGDSIAEAFTTQEALETYLKELQIEMLSGTYENLIISKDLSVEFIYNSAIYTGAVIDTSNSTNNEYTITFEKIVRPNSSGVSVELDANQVMTLKLDDTTNEMQYSWVYGNNTLQKTSEVYALYNYQGFYQSGDALIEVRSDNKVVYTTETGTKYYGYLTHQVINEKLVLYLHDSKLKTAYLQLQEHFEDIKAFNFEFNDIILDFNYIDFFENLNSTLYFKNNNAETTVIDLSALASVNAVSDMSTGEIYKQGEIVIGSEIVQNISYLSDSKIYRLGNYTLSNFDEISFDIQNSQTGYTTKCFISEDDLNIFYEKELSNVAGNYANANNSMSIKSTGETTLIVNSETITGQIVRDYNSVYVAMPRYYLVTSTTIYSIDIESSNAYITINDEQITLYKE